MTCSPAFKNGKHCVRLLQCSEQTHHTRAGAEIGGRGFQHPKKELLVYSVLSQCSRYPLGVCKFLRDGQLILFQCIQLTQTICDASAQHLRTKYSYGS